jgi:hypothetical protein
MGFGFGHAPHHPVATSHDAERRRCEYSALQGALVVVIGAALLIGLSFGAMATLAGPDGWITKAANTAVMGDSNVVMTAYAVEQGR